MWLQKYEQLQKGLTQNFDVKLTDGQTVKRKNVQMTEIGCTEFLHVEHWPLY